MNDKDIIEYLENEIKNKKLGYEYFLGQGHYPDEDIVKDIAKMQDILDLINRQKAENLELQGNLKFVRGTVARLLETSDMQQAKIEKLKEAYAVYEETTGLKQVRAEAIREFSERLKRKSRRISEYDEGGWYMDIRAVKVEDIDNLVKEMTEDTP